MHMGGGLVGPHQPPAAEVDAALNPAVQPSSLSVFRAVFSRKRSGCFLYLTKAEFLFYVSSNPISEGPETVGFLAPQYWLWLLKGGEQGHPKIQENLIFCDLFLPLQSQDSDESGVLADMDESQVATLAEGSGSCHSQSGSLVRSLLSTVSLCVCKNMRCTINWAAGKSPDPRSQLQQTGQRGWRKRELQHVYP